MSANSRMMRHRNVIEQSRRRHGRNRKIRALDNVREEREREQRALSRGLVREM
jgi:hypothetical protein